MVESIDINSISKCIDILNLYEKCVKKKFNNCNKKLKELDECIFIYLSS